MLVTDEPVRKEEVRGPRGSTAAAAWMVVPSTEMGAGSFPGSQAGQVEGGAVTASILAEFWSGAHGVAHGEVEWDVTVQSSEEGLGCRHRARGIKQ